MIITQWANNIKSTRDTRIASMDFGQVFAQCDILKLLVTLYGQP